MAITIQQSPLYRTLPIGQDIIFAVSEDNIVATELKVKFIAKVFISNNSSGLVSAANLRATLKTTPNNAGAGMFNLRSILESYISADNLANGGINFVNSSYKEVEFSDDKEFPMHLIDKFSLSPNAIKWFRVQFGIEYEVSNVITVSPYFKTSSSFLIFNGYVSNEDTLISSSGNYGYDLFGTDDGDFIQRSDTSKFLTNAPTTQYAQVTDYGTVAMFNLLNISTNSFETAPSSTSKNIYSIIIKLYNSADAQLGSDIEVENKGQFFPSTGGARIPSSYSNTKLLYFGCYPGNLNNWSTDWDTHKANVSYYTVQAFQRDPFAVDTAITQLYTINIISECKYEPIRLTWLNKLGTWDYYTFMKKSVRSIQTKGTTYTQLGGTWNESKFKIRGYKGGKKSFRVNAKESIRINTDFVNELESVWFEELMSSPEVYILNGYSLDKYESQTTISGILNKYVQPVLLTSTDFIRKTRANDKLIQYTFEIERNKDNRTQTV